MSTMQLKTRELALRHLYYNKSKLFAIGAAARLPEAYRKFFIEWHKTSKEPVHYTPEPGKWKRDPETGVVTPIQNIPIPSILPKQYNQVLSGGELVIQGFQKRTPQKRRVPHFWVPDIKRSVVYSEILDQYLSVLVTERLIEMIHKHQGLDTYLLSTKACNMNTTIALKLKRKLLLALRDKKLPYDEKKNQEIYEKYKQFLLPDDEVEWYGLTYLEAINKQIKIEEAEEEKARVPMKHKYRMELIQELQEQVDEANNSQPGLETTGWLSKVKNTFKSKEN